MVESYFTHKPSALRQFKIIIISHCLVTEITKMCFGDKRKCVYYFFRENIDRGTAYECLSTRPVSLLQHGDFIVLSGTDLERRAWKSMMKHCKLDEKQVIWAKKTLDDSEHEQVLQQISAAIDDPPDEYVLVPYVHTPLLSKALEKYPFGIIGDALNLCPTKLSAADLHFEDLSVKCPPVFDISQFSDMREGYSKTVSHFDGASMLLKLAHTQGGAGVHLIRSEQEFLDLLDSPQFQNFRMEDREPHCFEKKRDDYGLYSVFSAYFEKFVPNVKGTVVVTCYGAELLCITEQLSNGFAHNGNRFPARSCLGLDEERLVSAVRSVHNLYKFTGPWGMDLVVSQEDQNTVYYLVDINCGRFNGCHFPQEIVARSSKGWKYWECKKVEVHTPIDSFLERTTKLCPSSCAIFPITVYPYPKKSRILVCSNRSRSSIDAIWGSLLEAESVAKTNQSIQMA